MVNDHLGVIAMFFALTSKDVSRAMIKKPVYTNKQKATKFNSEYTMILWTTKSDGSMSRECLTLKKQLLKRTPRRQIKEKLLLQTWSLALIRLSLLIRLI